MIKNNIVNFFKRLLLGKTEVRVYKRKVLKYYGLQGFYIETAETNNLAQMVFDYTLENGWRIHEIKQVNRFDYEIHNSTNKE